MMLFIRRQYHAQANDSRSARTGILPGPHREQRVVIPVNGINRAVVQAVNFGRAIAPDVRAVYVTDDPEEAEDAARRWERQIPGVPLVIVESPYRAARRAPPDLPRRARPAWPPDKEAPITIVVLPEYVARTGGTACSTTRRRSASRRRSSGASTPSSPTSRTASNTEESRGAGRGRRGAAPRPARATDQPRTDGRGRTRIPVTTPSTIEWPIATPAVAALGES